MGCTPVLLYRLDLLPFGLALARFHPYTECYKRDFVGTSTQPYFVSYTHQRSDITSAHIFLGFARLLVSDSGSPRVRGTMQATFEMESGSYLGHWRNSDGGAVQDLVR
jgi:hypothetical protein